ncbi:MFS transporter [Georgenia sp. AZ-5]|uniref:MFS transporter n=1 Tax=Georgenia sp. AZ-5 TaxID=3367526 RepID=UPI003754DD3D
MHIDPGGPTARPGGTPAGARGDGTRGHGTRGHGTRARGTGGGTAVGHSSFAERLYSRLVPSVPFTAASLPEPARAALPANGLRLVAANALQSAGDQVVNAKTVLPWLLTSVGAPASLVALLVPIRESGSMLPQAAMTPWVRRRAVRKWVWVAGGAGQALATAAMALTAAAASGWAAGVAVLAALAVFALARSLSSLASKDVLGRTVPKGQRGQINGIATVLSGLVAITLGLGIRLLGGGDVAPSVLAWLLGGAAAAWVVALAVYARVAEPASEPEPKPAAAGAWWSRSWRLLRDDPPFRRFVLVRTLLLVSALSPPFVVTLAARQGGVGLSGLSPFLIASGLASLLGGRAFGRLADRSSRRLLVWGAGAASVVILGLLGLLTVPAARESAWLYPAAYLLLALTHTGVRVARKTYVVDMAEGDRRTEYVAVANTAMGVLLLVAGGISGALAQLGVEAALAFLAVLGLAGVVVGRTLPEVSR